MAYLALYRAFRPETLDEVVRQEHIVKILRNQIEQRRVGHAYLFCGPRGTGKTSIAKIFARSINCEHPVNGSPCGKCPTCRALSGGNSMDIVEIDAASNNGVDEMRNLREKVQYPPAVGQYKVYIIDEVHMLSQGAFNALLKTLEEPPRHIVFILATTEAQKIPATILSRCMRFDFKLIPQEDLEKHLKSVLGRIGRDYEEEAVAAIARAGAGSVRDMLSIADTCVSYEEGKLTYEAVNAVLGSADFSMMSRLCSAVLSADMPEALALTEKIISEGKGVGVLVRDIMQFLNSCAIAKMCRNAERILSLPEEMYRAVRDVADKTDGHVLLRVSEIFADVESRLRYTSSARILLETAVMKASMPQTDYDLDAVLGRISALENKVRALEGAGRETGTVPASAKAAEGTDPGRDGAAGEWQAEEVPPVSGWDMSAEDIASYPPAEEEPLFDGDYYYDGYASEQASAAEPSVKRPSNGVRQPQGDGRRAVRTAEESTQAAGPSASLPAPKEKPVPAEPAVAAAAAPALNKERAFGMFLRTLRKTGQGRLFSLCSELDVWFEGDTMVLASPNEYVCKALRKDDNTSQISQTLASVGVTRFEIRVKGEEKDMFDENMKTLRADFPDIDIKVR